MSRRKGIMLCYPFEEKRFNKWEKPVFIQPKLDGFRCMAKVGLNGVTLLSSEQNIIQTMPHIGWDLDRMIPDDMKPIILDGELYCHGMDFNEISSVITTESKPDERFYRINYHVFDINSGENQLDRLLHLSYIFHMGLSQSENVKLVPTDQVNSLDEVYQRLDQYTKRNYEGIILREYYNKYIERRSTYVMKFKPKKEDIYEIVERIEAVSEKGEPMGTLGAFLVRDSDYNHFRVGAGRLTHTQRQQIWDLDYFNQKKLRVGYQSKNPSGIPRFAVTYEIID